VTITINSIPAAPVAGSNATYCDTEVFGAMNAIGTGGNLTWYNNSALTNVVGTGSSLAPLNTVGSTTYYVTETNNGCESAPSTVVITITVCDTLELTIPTGFTPSDGDGVNDVWELVNLNIMYPDCIVQIYGRWGGLIFESVGYETPWDGKHKGALMPLGSYYFVIDLQDGSNPIKGTVTIIN
jgi:gliding motility-associated-like protein